MIKRLVALSAVSVALLSGLALGQDAKPSDSPLKGPAVKDDAVPGENRKFGGPSRDRKDRVGREIPHRLFMKAFDVLRGDKADSSVRLASDQSKKIEAIEQQYKDALHTFGNEHKTEIADIREKGGPEVRHRLETLGLIDAEAPKKGKGSKPSGVGTDAKDKMDSDSPAGAAPQDGNTKVLRAEIKKLLESAPKVDDFHAKMWAVLTEAQKPVVEKEIDRLRAEIKNKRTDKVTEPKKNKKGG